MTGPRPYFGFEFPACIWIYERDDEPPHDYESRAPGYGYSCGYIIPEVFSRTMTVYIYDRGRSDIPDRIDTEIARDEFYRSTHEAFSNRAFYSDVSMTDDGVCGGEFGWPFFFAAVTFTHIDRDEPRASLVAVTAWRSKFIKVRITRPPGGDAVQDMKRVIEAWSEYLWAVGDA